MSIRRGGETTERAHHLEKRWAAIGLAVFAALAVAIIGGESGAPHFETGVLHVGSFDVRLPSLRWVHMREGLGWMGFVGAATVIAATVVRSRRARTALSAVLAVTVCAAGILTVASLATLRPQGHDIRDQLLYYMGAKYYDEVGYNELNRCLIEAAEEVGVPPLERYRDLATNHFVNTQEVRSKSKPCRTLFSIARWAAFRKDVSGFVPGLTAWYGQWERTLLDYGFNGTPVLRRIISAAATVFPADHRGLTLISLLNLTAMMIAFYCVLAWIGPWESLVTALLLFVFPGDSFIHLWSIPRYFWFASILIAVALLNRGGKWAAPAAGALLAFSAALKAFPATWLIGPAILAAWALLKKRRGAPIQLMAGAAATAAVLFIWSVADAHHFANWTEFADRMRLNGNRPAPGCIGFAYNFLFFVPGPKYDIWSALQSMNTKIIGPVTMLHVQRVLQVLLSLAVVRASLRLDMARASMLSGFGMLFIWCIPVSYYYNAFLGLPLLFPMNRGRVTFVLFSEWLLIAAGISGLMFEHVHEAILYVKFLSMNFTLFLVSALCVLEMQRIMEKRTGDTESHTVRPLLRAIICRRPIQDSTAG